MMNGEMNNPILDIGTLKSPEITRLLRVKYDKLNNDTQRNFRDENDVHSICQKSLLIQDLHLVYCGNKRTKQGVWGWGWDGGLSNVNKEQGSILKTCTPRGTIKCCSRAELVQVSQLNSACLQHGIMS